MGNYKFCARSAKSQSQQRLKALTEQLSRARLQYEPSLRLAYHDLSIVTHNDTTPAMLLPFANLLHYVCNRRALG